MAYEVSEDRKKLVDIIIKNLEKGHTFEKMWDSTSLSAYNPSSGTKYLAGNKMRLANAVIEKEYKDNRWMTFKQIQSEGYKLKKGSKGIQCEKWIFTKEEKIKKDNGIEKIEVPCKPFAVSFTLFNGDNIEGLPIIEKKEISKDEYFKLGEEILKTSECPVAHYNQEQAFYRPGTDEICLPPRENFLNNEGYISTILHEMSHSTGHPSRLKRNLKGNFGSSDYAKEELRAELASVFIKSDLGIEIKTGEHFNNHTAYLESWIKVLKNDYNELFKAAGDAEKISERIVNNYNSFILEKEKNMPLEKKEVQEKKIRKVKEEFFSVYSGKDKLWEGNKKDFKDLIKEVRCETLKDKNNLNHNELDYALKSKASPKTIENIIPNFYEEAFYKKINSPGKIEIKEEVRIIEKEIKNSLVSLMKKNKKKELER